MGVSIEMITEEVQSLGLNNDLTTTLSSKGSIIEQSLTSTRILLVLLHNPLLIILRPSTKNHGTKEVLNIINQNTSLSNIDDGVGGYLLQSNFPS